MRYLSDDGKVFDTDRACYEYEQRIKREKENDSKSPNEMRLLTYQYSIFKSS